MDDIDAYLLRAFVTVAEQGTIADAARVLHRTQAAVSIQIKRLEEMLNTPLFERSRDGMHLNANGARLLPDARKILADLRQLHLTAIETSKKRLRVGAIEDIAALRLPAVMRGFARLHPEMPIDLIVGGNRSVAKMFSQGEIDIAICDSEVLRPKSPLVSWTADLVWVTSATIAPLNMSQLPVIMFSDKCSWRARAISALDAYHGAWEVTCEASTLVAMTTAIIAGAGIGLLLPEMVPPGCIALPFGAGPENVPVEFGVFAQGIPQKATMEFIDAIAPQAELPASVAS